jgi:septal ring factor EnvC (AmiA/AmiB activator)
LKPSSGRAPKGLSETALFESDRALAFGEEARDLGDRFGRRQTEARARRALEALPGPVPRPVGARQPPVKNAEARLPGYRLAVTGRLLRGTGELSDAGVHARGLVFETEPRSLVVSPADGRVVHAGPFRSYGQIVIIDHGDGWTSLITNLAERDVDVGGELAAGAPIGRTGRGQVSVELRYQGKPVAVTDQLR